MPENKELEENIKKEDARPTNDDCQESVERKDNSTKKEGKEQRNTRIIKKIIRGTKKEKSLDPRKFEEGICFRGKLIGVVEVNDARGDRLCQDSLQTLKAAVKSSGEHKQKIIMNVSFQGIKISDEKSNEMIYHHPVHMISFTSLDVNDNRAFGYICGIEKEDHKFVGIKTEKAACQVVLTLQDLFQAVLEKKKQAIENAKQLQMKIQPVCDVDNQVDNVEDRKTIESTEKSEPIYTDIVNSTENQSCPESIDVQFPSPKQSNVDDLLCLQLELDQLQQGIVQMDSSMAAVGVSERDNPFVEDPFNTSTFVLYPQKDIYESTAVSTTSSSEDQSIGSPLPDSASQMSQEGEETSSFYITYHDNDKYSVFSNIDTIPSVFENPSAANITTIENRIPISAEDNSTTADRDLLSPPPPPKPSRSQQLDIFAELDPLGKDRPFLDKKDFFHDIKNPPKKVLKDLIEKSSNNDNSIFYTSQSAPESTEVSTSFQSRNAFPCDFINVLPPQVPPRFCNVLSTSLPNSNVSVLQTSTVMLHENSKEGFVSIANGNPFKSNNGTEIYLPPPPPLPPRLLNRASDPSILNSNNALLGHRRGSTPTNRLRFSKNDAFDNKASATDSSRPIPIPIRKLPIDFQPSFENCSEPSINNNKGKTSEFSETELPNTVDIFGHSLTETVNTTSMTNLTENCSSMMINDNFHSTQAKDNFIYPLESDLLTANKTSSKLNDVVNAAKLSASNTGKTNCSSSLVSQSKLFSRPVVNCVQNSNNVICSESSTLHSKSYSMSISGNIFSRKLDPFADDFFTTLPKKFNGYQSVPNEL